jgi:hypothetical protein
MPSCNRHAPRQQLDSDSSGSFARLRTRVGVQMPLDAACIAHEMLDGKRRRPGGKIVLTLD